MQNNNQENKYSSSPEDSSLHDNFDSSQADVASPSKIDPDGSPQASDSNSSGHKDSNSQDQDVDQIVDDIVNQFYHQEVLDEEQNNNTPEDSDEEDQQVDRDTELNPLSNNSDQNGPNQEIDDKEIQIINNVQNIKHTGGGTGEMNYGQNLQKQDNIRNHNQLEESSKHQTIGNLQPRQMSAATPQKLSTASTSVGQSYQSTEYDQNMRELKNIKSKKKKAKDNYSWAPEPTKKVLNFRGSTQLVFNTYNTNYPIVDVAAKFVGFKIVYKDHNLIPTAELKAAHKIAPGLYATIQPEEFDVVWFDLPIHSDVLSKIKPHQRISQWPGIQVLSHKDKLAKNLKSMRSLYPDEYNFFPVTYLLPDEAKEFKKEFHLNGQPKPFIVKPYHNCQGRGIYLVKQFDDVENPDQSLVAQSYIDNPYLIDSLKFDLRLYVLVYGIHPLRIYLFDDGLARFATNSYQSAKEGDITDLFQHLTNYSINKNSGKYVQNETQDGGSGGSSGPDTRPRHKRSLKQIYRHLEEHGASVGRLKEDIKDLIVKTIITGQNSIYNTFRACQPDDLENQMCFQILGFDVIFDQNLKPWLLEINQSPSFATDSTFDYALKRKLMEDTFKLLNLTSERKKIYNEQKEKQYFARILRSSNKQGKPSFEEKEYKRFEIDKLRDAIEKPLLEGNGYALIFPVKDDESKMRQYTKYLKAAREIDDPSTYGRKVPTYEDNLYDIILNTAQKPEAKSPKKEPKAKKQTMKELINKVSVNNLIQDGNYNINKQQEEVKTKETKKKPKKEKGPESEKKQETNEQVQDRQNVQVQFTADKFDAAGGIQYPAVNLFTTNSPAKQRNVDRNRQIRSDSSQPKFIQNDLKKSLYPSGMVTPSQAQRKDRNQQAESKKALLSPFSDLKNKLQEQEMKKESDKTQTKLLTPVLDKKKQGNNTEARISSFQTPNRNEQSGPKADDQEVGNMFHKRYQDLLEYRNKYFSFTNSASTNNIAGPRRERSENRATLTSANMLNRPQPLKSEQLLQPEAQKFVPLHKRIMNKLTITPFARRPNHSQSRVSMLSPRQKLLNDGEAVQDGGIKIADCREKPLYNTPQRGSQAKRGRKEFDPPETIPEENDMRQEFRERMNMRAREHKAKLMGYQAHHQASAEDIPPTAEEPISTPLQTGTPKKEPKEEQKAIEKPQIQYVGLYDDVKKYEMKREQPKGKPKEKHIPPPAEEKKEEEKIQVQYVGLYDDVKKVEKKKEEVKPKEKAKYIPNREPKKEEKPQQIQYIDLYPHQDVVKVEKKRPLIRKKKTGFQDLYEQGTVVDMQIQQTEKEQVKANNGTVQPVYFNEQNLILENALQQYNCQEDIPQPLPVYKAVNYQQPQNEYPRTNSTLEIHRPMLSNASLATNTRSLATFSPEQLQNEVHGSTSISDQLLITPSKLDQSTSSSPSKKKQSAQKSKKKKPKDEQLNNKLARAVFLQLIDDLKAQGQDPVFNLTTDFTTNCHVGHGTLSVIKKCTHNKTGYQVALKTYEKKMLVRKSQLMGIHREIFILAGLNHPNIMKLFEVIDTRTHVNLVTEFCPGCNLLDYVRTFGRKTKIGKNRTTLFRLDEPVARKIFRQLGNVLSYLHDLGLVHKDLKIQNILIKESNQKIKMVDFSSAVSYQANDKLQMLSEAQQNNNPKQAKAKTLSGQAKDVYSLAIILYILLTGGVPEWAKVESELYPVVEADRYELPILPSAENQDLSEIQINESGFSEELRNLIREIFQTEGKSGSSKMDVREVLEHSWLQSEDD